MKRLQFTLASVCAIFLPIGLNSCISTDTIDIPSEPTAPKSQIILNVEAPAEAQTRADSDHRLRYIAKLYLGSSNNLSQEIYSRQEILEGDVEGNQIIFDVPAGNNYTILMFADYIPANSIQKNSQGLYTDYYYDTSAKDKVEIRPTPGATSDNIGPNFFNNDNYDCFADTIKVAKTEAKVERDIVLKRAVAKVRVVDTSKNSGDYKVSIKSTNIYTWFEFNNYIANFKESKSSSIVISKTLSGEDEQELFYYYSFATKNPSSKETLTLTFQPEGLANPINVEKFEINQNYITTIRGNFLPSKTSQGDPGETPKEDDDDNNPKVENGPIYLNMSVNSEAWGSLSSSWQ